MLDASSGAPIEAAFVRLVDEDGRRRAADFTDAGGRYRLEAPAPGRYRLRVQRLGYREAETGSLRIAAEAGRTRTFRLRPEATPLSDLEVTGEAECRSDPTSARRTFRLWREIRRTLRAVTWRSRERPLVVRSLRFTLMRDRRGRLADTLARQVREQTAWTTYASAPAGELSRDGYVRREGDRLHFFGPDARVLLSETFRRDHCFRITEAGADREGRIGLAFRPVEGRDRADVAGTLWVDRESAELREVEFRYVDTDLPATTRRLGGEVRFLTLPSGRQLIREWELWMPLYSNPSLLAGRGTKEVVGYRVRGESALEIRSPDRRTLYSAGAETGGTVEARKAAAGDTADGPAGADPVELPGVAVQVERRRTGKLAGFERRRDRRSGHFLDREDLEEVHTDRLSRVFQGLSGVTTSRCQGKVNPVSCRRVLGTRGAGRCGMPVYLDGAPWTGSINDLSKESLAAVEVYTGPAWVPAQYRMDTRCGVVLLWTRTGAGDAVD